MQISLHVISALNNQTNASKGDILSIVLLANRNIIPLIVFTHRKMATFIKNKYLGK